MQGEAGGAAPGAVPQRSGTIDRMGCISLRKIRAIVLAAAVAVPGAAAAIASGAVGVPGALASGPSQAAASDFFAGYEAFRRGDYEEARSAWSPLARAGDVDAQFNLGALFENGLGVPADAERAARWYRAAAERRLDHARLALARLQRIGALDPGPDEDQIKLLESAARRGLAEAQYELGVAYDRGLGVTQNHATAAGWYQRAAEQGLTDAQYNLATFYDEGLGTPRDIARAREWYARAADSGERRAMNNLGYIYEKGLGGVRDYDMAVVWYRRAAHMGLAIAQSNLAALHYLGRGVPRDFEQAHRWYKAAAAQGDAVGRNGLGLLYANGLGVDRDLVRAMALFELAAHSGSPAGADALTYSDRLAQLMTPAQQAEARALSLEIAARTEPDDTAGRPVFGVSLPRPADGFGDSVIYAQRLLKWLGYYDAAVDGLAGALTVKATRRFLGDNELPMAAQVTRELVEALEAARAARVAAAGAIDTAADSAIDTGTDDGIGDAPGRSAPGRHAGEGRS